MVQSASVLARYQILCKITKSSLFIKRNQKIAALCAQGLNCRQIGDFIGLTRARVSQITRQMGLKTKPRKITIACEMCGTEFTKFRILIVRSKHHYCSRECAATARLKFSPWFPCQVCQKPCRKRYCSQKCYHSVRQDGRYQPWREGQRKARKAVSKYFNLVRGNVVHHEDRDNRNNDLSNLRVFRNQSDHMAYHHGSPVVPLWDGKQVAK